MREEDGITTMKRWIISDLLREDVDVGGERDCHEDVQDRGHDVHLPEKNTVDVQQWPKFGRTPTEDEDEEDKWKNGGGWPYAMPTAPAPTSLLSKETFFEIVHGLSNAVGTQKKNLHILSPKFNRTAQKVSVVFGVFRGYIGRNCSTSFPSCLI